MAKTIALEIVTPEGQALLEQVAELTAPSVDGEFGVLPGLRPLLAALRTGLVSYVIDGETTQVAVGPGFVEVLGERTVIMTEKFCKKEDVDAVRVRLALKEADRALDEYSGEPGSAEYAALVEAEVWAAAQLELYGDPPPPTIRIAYDAGPRSELLDAASDGEAPEDSAAHK